MTDKGICGIIVYKNNTPVVRIFGDRKVYEQHDSNGLLVTRQEFIQLIKSMLYEVNQDEFNSQIDPILKNKTADTRVKVKADSIRMMSYVVNSWTDASVIKGSIEELEYSKQVLKYLGNKSDNIEIKLL